MVLVVTGRQKVLDMVPTMRRRVEQGDIVQVHLNALGGVVRVKEHIDPGSSADGLVDDLGVFCHVQGERLVRDRLEYGRRADGVELFLLACAPW